MIGELDQIVVIEDLADLAVCAGDIGTVVHVYEGGKAFEVEFVSLSGKAIGTATLATAMVRPILEGEIAHARLMAA
jgi:hypothetical protein